MAYPLWDMNICEAYSKNSPWSACDRAADAVVDAYLRIDPKSQVDITVLNAHGLGMIAGNVESRANLIFEKSALEAGEKARKGMFSEIVANVSQTPRSEDEGGRHLPRAVVRGYATSETPERLPRAYVAAHAIVRAFDDWREDRSESVDPNMWVYARIATDRDIQPNITIRVFGRAASTIVREEDLKAVADFQARKVFDENFFMTIEAGEIGTEVFFSGSRACARGYEGILPGNGDVFSGKDPHHAFRAGTLMARFAAKSLVEEGLVKNCLITAVYDGGEAPIFLHARDGNGRNFTTLVEQKLNFRIPFIVERFALARPIYESMADYGPFFSTDSPWENVTV